MMVGAKRDVLCGPLRAQLPLARSIQCDVRDSQTEASTARSFSTSRALQRASAPEAV